MGLSTFFVRIQLGSLCLVGPVGRRSEMGFEAEPPSRRAECTSRRSAGGRRASRLVKPRAGTADI